MQQKEHKEMIKNKWIKKVIIMVRDPNASLSKAIKNENVEAYRILGHMKMMVSNERRQ